MGFGFHYRSSMYEMGCPCCTALPLCFVFLVIIETVYCTWKICKFSQLLRTILFVIPFLWREWQFTVQRTASSQEELSHGLPNQDRNGNRHRCLRISTVIANRKEKYGTCKAAQQLWSFPLTSDSALSPRPFVPLAAAWPLSPACFSLCVYLLFYPITSSHSYQQGIASHLQCDSWSEVVPHPSS